MEYGACPRSLDEVRGRLLVLQGTAPLHMALPVQAGLRHSYQFPVLAALWKGLLSVPGCKAIFWWEGRGKHEITDCGYCQGFSEILHFRSLGVAQLFRSAAVRKHFYNVRAEPPKLDRLLEKPTYFLFYFSNFSIARLCWSCHYSSGPRTS